LNQEKKHWTGLKKWIVAYRCITEADGGETFQHSIEQSFDRPLADVCTRKILINSMVRDRRRPRGCPPLCCERSAIANTYISLYMYTQFPKCAAEPWHCE
jgi:hypothetical protein